MLGKPLDKGTILSGWSDLAWIVCITFSRPEMCRALRVTCFLEHQVRILHRMTHRENYVVQSDVLKLFEGQKRPFAPDNLCTTCFLEGTRFPLQCARLSEPPFFSCVCKEHSLVGAMFYIVAYCFLVATISDEDRATWEWESPFLSILVPSSCLSGATVSACFGVNLGRPVALLL